MKARIKKTGEILKVADYAVIAMENCDSYGSPLEYTPEEVELIHDSPTTDSINWEQRRFELVKAATQALIEGGWRDATLVAHDAVHFTDTVLAEYRKTHC